MVWVGSLVTLGLRTLWLKRWDPLLVVRDLGLVRALSRSQPRRVESDLYVLMGRAPWVLWQRLGRLLLVHPDFGLLLSFLSLQAPVDPLLRVVSAVLFLS